jgi:hypothetical protein
VPGEPINWQTLRHTGCVVVHTEIVQDRLSKSAASGWQGSGEPPVPPPELRETYLISPLGRAVVDYLSAYSDAPPG